LLLQGQVWLTQATQIDVVRWALWGGSAGLAATLFGALPAVFLTRLKAQHEDAMLGMAAGMMLAAAAFSLLLPGIEAGTQLTGHAFSGAGLVVLGMSLGVMLMLGLDAFTPHEHDKTGPCGPGHERCQRVWLFVMAVAIHNLPEGMAVGVGFAQGDLSVGLPLATAIALQDIPEGLAVAMTLRAIGTPAWKAVGIAALGGLLEPIGALIGVSLVGNSALAYPVGLGLAAGAMLFVVSHEVIPETHRNGHQTTATLGLMAGFALMMVLDTSLG
jgi:ZIP family zinc transporter